MVTRITIRKKTNVNREENDYALTNTHIHRGGEERTCPIRRYTFQVEVRRLMKKINEESFSSSEWT